ncbi:MAG: hypothetical protein ACI857_001331 [Arenicella sp.]|jgi:hypothetical protein
MKKYFNSTFFSWRGIITFIILYITVLILGAFILHDKFSTDIIGKNLDWDVIFEIYLLGSYFHLFALLPLLFFIWGFLSKIYAKNKSSKLDLIVIFLGFLFAFQFIHTRHPKASIAYKSLMYDIQLKPENESLERFDESLFESGYNSISSYHLFHQLDTVQASIDSLDLETVRYIKNMTEPSKIDSLLHELDLSESAITQEQIKADTSQLIGEPYHYRRVADMARMKLMMTKYRIDAKENLCIELWRRCVQSVYVILLLLIGINLGAIFKHLHRGIVAASAIITASISWVMLFELTDVWARRSDGTHVKHYVVYMTILGIALITSMLLKRKFGKANENSL